MKNLQTILLGLVIALGVIYVGYNETRIGKMEAEPETHAHKGYSNHEFIHSEINAIKEEITELQETIETQK